MRSQFCLPFKITHRKYLNAKHVRKLFFPSFVYFLPKQTDIKRIFVFSIALALTFQYSSCYFNLHVNKHRQPVYVFNRWMHSISSTKNTFWFFSNAFLHMFSNCKWCCLPGEPSMPSNFSCFVHLLHGVGIRLYICFCSINSTEVELCVFVCDLKHCS